MQTVAGTYGKSVYGSGRLSVSGDNQISTLVCRGTTSASLTPRTLTSDGAVSPTTSNVFTMYGAKYASVQVTTDVVARDTDGNIKKWNFDCMFKVGDNVLSASLEGVVVCTVMSSSVSASSWEADIYANTTRGSFEVVVTGSATQNIRWVARMNAVELAHITANS